MISISLQDLLIKKLPLLPYIARKVTDLEKISVTLRDNIKVRVVRMCFDA